LPKGFSNLIRIPSEAKLVGDVPEVSKADNPREGPPEFIEDAVDDGRIELIGKLPRLAKLWVWGDLPAEVDFASLICPGDVDLNPSPF
jgi:hypothetical protein